MADRRDMEPREQWRWFAIFIAVVAVTLVVTTGDLDFGQRVAVTVAATLVGYGILYLLWRLRGRSR
jgi:hypothetical protein